MFPIRILTNTYGLSKTLPAWLSLLPILLEEGFLYAGAYGGAAGIVHFLCHSVHGRDGIFLLQLS